MLARAGAFVVVNYVSGEDAAQTTLNLVTEAGGQAAIRRFDVKDPVAVDEAVSSLAKEFGKIDILVNNAGVSRDGLLGMNERCRLERGAGHQPVRGISSLSIREQAHDSQPHGDESST